jgi:hypothetical protein
MEVVQFLSAFLFAMQGHFAISNVTISDPYEGCCSSKAIETTLGKSLIYVPNIFTPNDDGLNDTFRPFYDEKNLKITKFEILSKEDKIIWENENFNPEKPFDGWLGVATKDSTYTGLFKYNMIFTDKNGGNKAITGSACSVVCKEKVAVNIKDKTQCFFPMQYQKDSVNHFSPIFLEVDCLQNK